ncbi:MAG: hypothetical protein ACRDY1_12595, partial [Acidimicrobiales bacterium]
VWVLALARRPGLALATLAASVLLLSRRLRGLVSSPATVAATIAGGGTAKAALPSLEGLTRAWAPAVVVALVFRRTRRAAAAALVAPALHRWWTSRADSGLDPTRFAALSVVDDLSYGTGVWAGSVTARTVRPLLPRVALRSRVFSSGALRAQLDDDPVDDASGRGTSSPVRPGGHGESPAAAGSDGSAVSTRGTT